MKLSIFFWLSLFFVGCSDEETNQYSLPAASFDGVEQMSSIITALHVYYREYGKYPNSLNDLENVDIECISPSGKVSPFLYKKPNPDFKGSIVTIWKPFSVNGTSVIYMDLKYKISSVSIVELIDRTPQANQ